MIYPRLSSYLVAVPLCLGIALASLPPEMAGQHLPPVSLLVSLGVSSLDSFRFTTGVVVPQQDWRSLFSTPLRNLYTFITWKESRLESDSSTMWLAIGSISLLLGLAELVSSDILSSVIMDVTGIGIIFTNVPLRSAQR